ncbi:MAG: FAD-binding protein, partial [Clostridia bacterium]|nr:FAD-binding protein [Clostridia bacterium]
MKYQLIVIGAGPAGLAAAISARNNGLTRIAMIERDREAGGILNQCIHNGFGLHRFKEELSGPEYAGRFIDMLEGTSIELLTDTM